MDDRDNRCKDQKISCRSKVRLRKQNDTEIQNDAWKLRSGGNLRAHIPTAEQKIRDVCGSWKPLPRVLPFAIFMAFIAPVEGILYLEKYIPSLADWSFEANLWLYPAKTAAVIACLVYFWPCYEELKGRGFGIGWKGFAFSIAVGAGFISPGCGWIGPGHRSERLPDMILFRQGRLPGRSLQGSGCWARQLWFPSWRSCSGVHF